jgi:RES domain-containing protein
MPTAWRIVKTRRAADAFDGEGARKFGGRWTSPGTRVVYTASSQSLAALEMLVHLHSSQLLDAYSVIPVTFADRLIEVIELAGLPGEWRHAPVPAAVQAIGDDWVRAGRSAVLKLPSAVVPAEWNYLLNPAHADFGEISVGAAAAFEFDSRLK